MNENELKKILKKSLSELVQKDLYLITHDVHEQSISSKLACYLSKHIISTNGDGWDIDVEYNRNGEVPKSLLIDGGVNVKPDIIIHRRGLNNPTRIENNNLLVIEIKKNPNLQDEKSDKKKIKSFMKESPYYYLYGAFISINSGNPPLYKISWFDRSDLEELI